MNPIMGLIVDPTKVIAYPTSDMTEASKQLININKNV